jgi:DNA-binding MarR family transcriptional regulator
VPGVYSPSAESGDLGVYDDALAEVGLKVSQFSLLNAIASKEDTRPAELAKLLVIDESTLSRNVTRMCTRGWLRLSPVRTMGGAIKWR